MSQEVKIVYADVENQLSEMNQAGESLDTKAETPITGNTMDSVTKLTELSSQLEQLLTSYQMALFKNVKTTENSVAFMRESDAKISAAINSVGPGPRRVMQ
ncbi:YwqI/YxiC family protein [Sporosarcina sp. NPDC096371]|uniref:YwqI/YxiC family protein n=1 Tax=Sporosarcina sp. NPDC096371 TaxID=3364530 RepID=UPI0037FC4572